MHAPLPDASLLPADAVRFDPGVALADWGGLPADVLVSGTPHQRGHLYIDDKARGLQAGVWDCTAMTCKMSPYPVDEFMLLLEGAVEIVLPDGRVTRVEAGQSFVIPKGLVCQWRQPGYVKKIFVILETPDRPTDRPCTGLAVALPDPGAVLAPSAGPAPAALLSGDPVQRTRQFFEDAGSRLTVGVWDTTAYHRKTMPFPRHELMCLLEGAVTITGPGGSPQTFRAGESFFVPYGAVTDFRTDGYLKKIYVIYQP
jgi:uncharacterized cupin superfamily protein